MKSNKILLAICFLSIIGTLAIYSSLPDVVPLHWGVNGEVDRWGSKVSMLGTAFLPLAVYGLMIVLPRIDPKKESFVLHDRAYRITRALLILFLIGIHWATILVSLGYPINITLVVTVGIGLLFMFMGNYLSQVRQNYSFGIRTPWALANEKVWTKTHRFGGFAFIFLGFLSLFTYFVPTPVRFIYFFVLLMACIISTFLYSYLVYRKLEK